jgi:cbb3-type cytochrome oxidase subunit 3
MEKINYWLSLIFSAGLTFFLGVIFDWGTLAVVLCLSFSWLVLYTMGQQNIAEMNAKELLDQKEDENRELINKALKHYAETKGIK